MCRGAGGDRGSGELGEAVWAKATLAGQYAMNQTAKDRAWKLFEIAFYAALASFTIVHWKSFVDWLISLPINFVKDIIDLTAGIASQALVFGLLLAALATFAMLLLGLLFVAGKVLKFFSRHD